MFCRVIIIKKCEKCRSKNTYLNKNTVKDLAQTQQLQNFARLGVHLVDTAHLEVMGT